MQLDKHTAEAAGELADKLGLIKSVYDNFFTNTESFRDDNVGACIAYLIGAILNDSSWDCFDGGDIDDQCFYELLCEFYPQNHVIHQKHVRYHRALNDEHEIHD